MYFCLSALVELTDKNEEIESSVEQIYVGISSTLRLLEFGTGFQKSKRQTEQTNLFLFPLMVFFSIPI